MTSRAKLVKSHKKVLAGRRFDGKRFLFLGNADTKGELASEKARYKRMGYRFLRARKETWGGAKTYSIYGRKSN